MPGTIGLVPMGGNGACGEWMKIAKAPCALRAGHKGSHNAAYRWKPIIAETEPPAEYEGLCAKWMPRAQSWCGENSGHEGRCLTLAKVKRSKRLQSALTTERNTRRRELLYLIKQTAGCADCGYDAHPAALDFDHLDGSVKRGDISKMLTVTLRNLFEEIAKCEVVCANCHRIRTFERKLRR
jgi:hypothetical protein